MNGTNQSKTKITDENEAFLFWLAVNGKPQSLNDKIQEWIAKGYLEAVGPVLLREANKNLFFERSREDKFHPKPKIVLDKLEQYSSSVGLNIAIDERMFFEKEFIGKPADYTATPLLATLGITSLCNFKCRYCGNDSGRRGKEELSLKEIFGLLRELGNLQILKLTLTGGEPLLKERFFEILRFAAERIPRVTVTSNGSLIDKKISQRLKKEGVSALKISIDGTEDFHDKNRGYKGAYQKALQAIRYLTAEGIEVRVQSTLMRENTGSIVELMPVLSGLGARVHSIVPVSPIGRARPQRLRRSVGGQASGDLMLSPKEYKDYVLGVNRAAKEINSKTVFEIRPVFGLDFKNNLEVLSTKYKCEALKTTFEITPTGKVVPCSFFPMEMGDIRISGLQDIWVSDRAHQIRRVFDDKLLEGKCRDCQIRKECGGGCPANSYAIYKKHHLGDVYCWK